MGVRMVLPPGFRFHPTDDELLAFYLYRKAAGMKLHSNVIAEVDLYKHDPWDLPNHSCISSQDSEAWYFFHSSDKKYPKGSRTNRATASGYWKATGRDRKIAASSQPTTLLGLKKTLVFYKGRAPHGERTDWVMHEYQLAAPPTGQPSSNDPPLVVCRVIKKKSKCATKPVSDSLLLAAAPSHLFNEFASEPPNLPTISLYAEMEEPPHLLPTRVDSVEVSKDKCDDDDDDDDDDEEEEKEY